MVKNSKRRKGLLSSLATAVDIARTGRFFSLSELRDYSKFHNSELGDGEAFKEYVLGETLPDERSGFRIALHTHTKQTDEYVHGSDGLSTLPEMLSAAEKEGLDAIVVSDHASRKSLSFSEDLDGRPFGTGLGWYAVEEAKKLGYDGSPGKPIVIPGVEAEVQNGIHVVIIGSDYSDYSGFFRDDKFDSLVSDFNGAKGTLREREAALAVHFDYVDRMRKAKLDSLLEYLAGKENIVTVVPHPGTIYTGAGKKFGWGADARETGGNGEEALFLTFVRETGAKYGAIPETARGVGIIRHKELAEYERRARNGGYIPAVVATPDAHLDGMVGIYATEIAGLSREDFNSLPEGLSKMKAAFREDHSLRAQGNPAITSGMPAKYKEPGVLEELSGVYCKHIEDTIIGRGQFLIGLANSLSKHYMKNGADRANRPAGEGGTPAPSPLPY